MPMELLVITVETPWGRAEGFILEEMFEIKRQGVELIIIPRNPPKKVFHKKAEPLLEYAIWSPLIDFKMLIYFFKSLLTNISGWKILRAIIFNSHDTRILIKNMVVLPKGFFIAKMIRRRKVKHIHAHWGTTTATMAYIVSKLTNIPWSFTVHRWDIKENNILEEKTKSAKFVRCISECGKRELLQVIGNRYSEKIVVVHMGVKIPIEKSREPKKEKNDSKFTMVTPANLLEVKGHRYLIDACSLLLKKGVKHFQCIFHGEGPLRADLEKLVKNKLLTEHVFIPGVLLPHEELMNKYESGEIDIVVLPSIITNKGEHEGIPVSAIEAMAHKIPVISTNTGGIPELLNNGAGLMVNEKSPSELAEAILKIVSDRDTWSNVSSNGYAKIEKEYDISITIKKLLQLVQERSLC